MLFDRRGHVFVARRIDMPSEAWQMPQGGIDEGEDPRTAALRELREEIGTDRAEIVAETAGWLTYDLPVELARALWGGRYRGQTQKWFAARFLGSDSEIDLATASPEFNEWKWTPPHTLPGLIVPFKRNLYERLLEELGPAITATAVFP
jgi:putative (di)nucleoside polyphosphate hydrolase